MREMTPSHHACRPRLHWLMALLWVVVSCCAASAHASERWSRLADQLFYRWYGPDQGLPHDVITALAQDGQGFLWVGTQDGLARWDGYRFKVYQPDAKNPHALLDNYIESLHTDYFGRLWVGTSNGGLARYDPLLDRFVLYPVGKNGLSNVAVRSIADDGQYGLWIGTGAGVDHLQFKDEHISSLGRDMGGHLGEQVRTLLRDRQGDVWIGTQGGWLGRLNKRHELTTVTLPLGDDKPSGVSSLTQDEHGTIWVGTMRHGAFMLDPANLQARAVRESGPGNALAGEWVVGIINLGGGRVWIATFGHGVVEYDSQSGFSRRLEHDPTLANGLPNNTVMSMHKDRAGLVWLGTQRGLVWFDPRQDTIFNLLGGLNRARGVSDIDVRSVLETSDGMVWAGLGSNGIDIIDPVRGRVRHLAVDPKHPETALQKDRISALAQLPNHQVVIGSDRGIYLADEAGNQVRRLRFPARGPELGVRSLFFDGQQLWVGGMNDGLWILSADALHLQRPAGKIKLSDDRISAVSLRPGGGMWVGTRYGLNLMQPGQPVRSIFPEPANPDALPHGFVASMVQDRKGRLWIGMQGGGVAIMDNQNAPTPHFKRIGVAEGLPNLNVDMMLQDPGGAIWVSTDSGVAKIDPDTLRVQTLRQAEGLHIIGYWTGAGICTSKGELLFGGANGLTVINPATQTDWNYVPPVLITDVRVQSKPVLANRFNDTAEHALAPLQIHPEANSMAVEFAALDFTAPERNRYGYRLEGYEREWNETDASRRVATYTNLPPGDYRLHLRGSNRNGLISERVLPIQVLPAWYQTWWFRVLLGLLGLSLLWVATQARTRVLRHRQRLLEQQIEKHTQRLREQQAELLQQAKLASLGTLTAGVAHEINNPANFALVGSYNMQRQLTEFNQWLLQLAGEDATPVFLAMLRERFAELESSLTAITEGATRIRNLVKDLRTFSRLEEADIKRVAITDSLSATINLVRAQYADLMRIECQFEATPRLECSPVKLNQVFMNLMVNAYQAIAARPPERAAKEPGCLIIRSRMDGNCLLFEFEDNGIGIPEASLSHIFDPFFTTKGVGQGMGMGLSISFGIMEQHHGSISVRSTLGQGTCFTLRLPLPSGPPVES